MQFDSIAVSLFGSGQNKYNTSHHQIEYQIQITILILRRGALSRWDLVENKGFGGRRCGGGSSRVERQLLPGQRQPAIGRSQPRNTAWGPNPPANLQIQMSLQIYLLNKYVVVMLGGSMIYLFRIQKTY